MALLLLVLVLVYLFVREALKGLHVDKGNTFIETCYSGWMAIMTVMREVKE